MSDHTPTSEAVIEHPEHIPGYTYGTDEAATSPLSLQDLERLKEAVWLTPEDKQALREAAEILADQADSLNHIPLRYLLAFTAVVIATSRDYLAAKGASPEQVDRMHAAFTKSVMLHVTVWTRPYVGAADW
jgi:hypothetical protein